MKTKIKSISFILAAVLLLNTVLASCGKNKAITVYAKDGSVIASVDDLDNFYENLTDKGLAAFVYSAVEEAIVKLSDEKNITPQKSRTLLSGSEIYTEFDVNTYNKASEFLKSEYDGAQLGIVLTNLKGGAVFAYSYSPDGLKNNITDKKSPHSSFKPLSVYAPSIEAGIINWATTVNDSPVKQLQSKSGKITDWPENADNRYLYKDVTVSYALAHSLNTVAVKVLNKYGVLNSVSFLEEKLNMDLSAEKSLIKNSPEDISGNIALGSLVNGVTVTDMAGYYQIFAGKGDYQPVHFVTEIKKGNKSLYTFTENRTPVLSVQSAGIMNKLLQGAVQNGTGREALVDGVETGGKTGTGETNADNWFIGFTPEFICAVWHGGQLQKNNSPLIFSKILTQKYTDENNLKKVFPEYQGVKKETYNTADGTEAGYFAADNMPKGN